MTLIETLPILAAVLLILFMISSLFSAERVRKSAWIVPAILSALFGLWSVAAVLEEGPLGFWTEHTRNMWGNQIWFDLLLAVGIGWVLIVPKARALGMKLPLWLIFVLCTGCIGFCAMLSRYLYLRDSAKIAS